MSSLKSVFNGLTATAEDMVNFDQAEEVGEKIKKSLDGVAVTSAKIKKSRTMLKLFKTCKQVLHSACSSTVCRRGDFQPYQLNIPL